MEKILEQTNVKLSLKDKIKIPEYTLAEELMNAISHGVGALFAIAALVLSVVVSAIHQNVWGVVASAVYGGTLIILYMMSTLYHSLKVNNAKRVFRIIDHCSIYLLIAGTYTPYTLVALRGPFGWVLFGIVWGSAVAGIVFNAIDMNRYKVISMVAYIAMGWVIIFAVRPLSAVIGFWGMFWLIMGGVLYTLGAVFYGLGKKHRFVHSVFHLFVLAGSVCQFFSILLYVL